LAAYVAYNFIVKVSKDNRLLIVEAIILIVEMNIPPLQVNTPAGYSGRRININEELEFTIIP